MWHMPWTYLLKVKLDNIIYSAIYFINQPMAQWCFIYLYLLSISNLTIQNLKTARLSYICLAVIPLLSSNILIYPASGVLSFKLEEYVPVILEFPHQRTTAHIKLCLMDKWTLARDLLEKAIWMSLWSIHTYSDKLNSCTIFHIWLMGHITDPIE